MSDKSVVIVNATINSNEKEAFKYYVENSSLLFKKAGGIPVSKYKITETIIGDNNTKIIATMEFSSDEVARNVFDSDEYKALLPYREKAFTALNVFIGKLA